MFSLQNVSKKFGGNVVLNNVSLDVNRGDVVAILGPSGSGKTTLLRCAGYLTKADSGTLVIGDEQYDMKKISAKDLRNYRRRVGFVFQTFNLYGNKTALGNVTLGLRVSQKMPKDEAEKIGRSLLERVGLADRMDYYPSELSGGQQQRVAIARALATNEMEFAKKVATRVVFMEDGEIVEENTAKEFFENPQKERTKEFITKSSTWAAVEGKMTE